MCTFAPVAGHRALPDVEAMEDIFSHESLKYLLPLLPAQEKKAQDVIQQWQKNKELRRERRSLKHSLGQQISYNQANRLLKLGLKYLELRRIREKFTDEGKFQRELQRRGVHSRPLREILTKALSDHT